MTAERITKDGPIVTNLKRKLDFRFYVNSLSVLGGPLGEVTLS